MTNDDGDLVIDFSAQGSGVDNLTLTDRGNDFLDIDTDIIPLA